MDWNFRSHNLLDHTESVDLITWTCPVLVPGTRLSLPTYYHVLDVEIITN